MYLNTFKKINYEKYRCLIFQQSVIFKLSSEFDEPEIIELGFNAKVHSFSMEGYVYLDISFHNNTDDDYWSRNMFIEIFVDVKVLWNLNLNSFSMFHIILGLEHDVSIYKQ